MKQYKKYVLGGVFACFMAVALMAPAGKSEAFWSFGKAKKENNANYTGAVANTESNKVKPVPSITVISPNGGETLKAGKNFNIKWKSKNIQKNGVLNIAVVEKESGVNHYIASNFDAKKNNYVWKIPLSFISGEYKMRVFCTIKDSDYGCLGDSKDESDGFFSIVQIGNVVGVTVVSPNGGEVWKIGETKIIKWKTEGIPLDAQINIEIFEEGTDKEKSTVIFHGLSATTTSYRWKVGGGAVEPGKKYRIIIKALPIIGGNYIATDVSDKPFFVSPNIMP